MEEKTIEEKATTKDIFLTKPLPAYCDKCEARTKDGMCSDVNDTKVKCKFSIARD